MESTIIQSISSVIMFLLTNVLFLGCSDEPGELRPTLQLPAAPGSQFLKLQLNVSLFNCNSTAVV